MKLAAIEGAIHNAASASAGRVDAALYPPGIQQALDAIPILDDVEPALIEAIHKRVEMLDRARKDLRYRAAEFDKCRKDPVYFVNNWAWTYDPRRSPSNIPFNLFEPQADFLTWLKDRIRGKECGVVEKSRDMGLSWLCVAFAAHQFIFIPGAKITFGSRKRDLVDKVGDPDSLFEKLRQLMDQLPLWLKPKNYDDSFLKFINRDNGSTVTGESGDNMGRGGRSRLYFLDEFAFVARAKKVDAAVSNNSDVRIYVSTPNGDGNSFAKKRFSGKLPVFRCHWLDDPRKNYWYLRDTQGELVKEGHGRNAPQGALYPWYEKMKATLDPIILAQEVDIDYNASKEGVVIPNHWILAAVELGLAPTGKKYAGLDVADEGGNINVLVIRQGVVIKLIESWAYGNTTQTAYRARNFCDEHRVKQLNYDPCGVGAGVGGTLASAEELSFGVVPVNGGAATSDRFYESYNRKAEDLFKNLRAEIWWNMRLRFERTFEHVNRIAEYHPSELISIPNHPDLISQLNQPLYKFNDSGQIVIESKIDMKKRGVDSPDYADALAYSFYEGSASDDLGWLANA